MNVPRGESYEAFLFFRKINISYNRRDGEDYPLVWRRLMTETDTRSMSGG